MDAPAHSPLRLSEVFGLHPLGTRLREARLALGGDAHTPRSRWDYTSLKQFTRVPGPLLWLGIRPRGRLVPISNLYSYVQPPPELGWSVRVTTARDFLGTQLTYDSHNGTDLAVPVGTTVVAAAPGVVRRISSEFNRGGLKVFLDHGEGLITTYNHLARSLVRVGDRVARGEPIALSGYSGLDGFATFPVGIPHVHFNVWLDGEYVDPFAPPGATPLWRAGNWPVPFGAARHGDDPDDGAVAPNAWDRDAIEHNLAACVHPGSRDEIRACADLDERAVTLLFHMNYFPTRFTARAPVYRTRAARRGRLDLPFRAQEWDGVWFPHGVEPAR